MRGKHGDISRLRDIFGITPAGAGKTRKRKLLPELSEDHPRRCGENYILNCEVEHLAGSPPQVRGKPITEAFKADIDRITPAGAGKTVTRQSASIFKQDHPRRCGENLTLGQPSIVARGSPPQVRGKHGKGEIMTKFEGITPAGAGKTLKRSFRNQPFCS